MRNHPNSCRPMTDAEQQFWKWMKSYFTTLEEDEQMHWSDVVILIVMTAAVSWALVLGLSVLSQIWQEVLR